MDLHHQHHAAIRQHESLFAVEAAKHTNSTAFTRQIVVQLALWLPLFANQWLFEVFNVNILIVLILWVLTLLMRDLTQLLPFALSRITNIHVRVYIVNVLVYLTVATVSLAVQYTFQMLRATWSSPIISVAQALVFIVGPILVSFAFVQRHVMDAY